MRKSMFVAVIFTMALVTSGLSMAQEKITVSSNQQSIDYANRILTYQGDVKAVWKDYTLQASEMYIYLTPQNTLDKLIATGNVKVKQGTKFQGSCERITYTLKDGILILEGNVNYKDDLGNSLVAQKITIWTLEKKLKAEGTPVEATYILKGGIIGTPGGKSK